MVLRGLRTEDDFETIQLAYLAGNSMLSNHLGLEGAPADFISKFIGSEEIVDNKYDEVSDEYKLVLEGYALGLIVMRKSFLIKFYIKTFSAYSKNDAKIWPASTFYKIKRWRMGWKDIKR